MHISKKVMGLMAVAVLALGGFMGFMLSRSSYSASAETAAIVDEATLTDLYEVSFGRPVDEDGRKFHVGRRLKDVLRDISQSKERRYYVALFKSVKAYEEALRAPGELSAEEKQKYLDTIDSALATLIAWVETLPDQDYCRAIITSERAREAIKQAYDNLEERVKLAAEKGIINSGKHLGRPDILPLPIKRCLLSPSPLPAVSASVSPSPSASPSSN